MSTKATKKASPSSKPKRVFKPRAAQTHEVRIIGGLWKRTKLKVSDKPGLRPTPDRVRETLFNWLGQDLTGWRVLDAFAGCGALGFEAASRGAASVLMIERDIVLSYNLKATQERLQAATVRVQGADAISWMSRCPAASYELVLLDPPFDAGLSAAAVAVAKPLLVPGGWLYLEAAAPLEELPAGLREHRRLRAGAVSVQLLQVD
jgi:16S rRNA (guanine(966)-N(2))-methyltransferase RsmD